MATPAGLDLHSYSWWTHSSDLQGRDWIRVVAGLPLLGGLIQNQRPSHRCQESKELPCKHVPFPHSLRTLVGLDRPATAVEINSSACLARVDIAL